jgi:O-antigen/teichoic acid export membrane protein
LRRNLLWTLMGDTTYAACQWGMLIVIAKLGNAEMVGQFALGLAVTTPIILLTGLALRSIQATDARREYAFGDYLGLRLITAVFALAVIVGIVLATGYRRETGLVIIAIGLAKVIEATSDVFYGLLQQHERMDYIGKSQLLKGPLSLTAMALAVSMTGDVLWGATGLIAAWALILLAYDVRNGSTIMTTYGRVGTIRPRWDFHVLRRLVWLALPLGMATMLIAVNTSIPRYYIERALGERELGIFAAMAYLMLAGEKIINAAGQSAFPRLGQYYARRNTSAFRTLLLKMMGLASLMAAAGVCMSWWFGRELLTLLYTPEYAARADVLVWVMVAAGIGYFGSCLGYGITATRAYGRFLLPYMAVTLVTVAASAVLIPARGIMGAAWVLCITALVSCAAPLLIFQSLRKARHELPQSVD